MRPHGLSAGQEDRCRSVLPEHRLLPCRLLFEIRDRVCPDPFRVRGAEDVAKSVSVVDDGLVSLSCNGMEHLHRPPYRPNPDAYDIALADRQVDRNRLSHTDQAGNDNRAGQPKSNVLSLTAPCVKVGDDVRRRPIALIAKISMKAQLGGLRDLLFSGHQRAPPPAIRIELDAKRMLLARVRKVDHTKRSQVLLVMAVRLLDFLHGAVSGFCVTMAR